MGEVVFQNFMSMHCAIIGWDKVLKAPDIWIQMVRRSTHFVSP